MVAGLGRATPWRGNAWSTAESQARAGAVSSNPAALKVASGGRLPAVTYGGVTAAQRRLFASRSFVEPLLGALAPRWFSAIHWV
jgi:hypothetical protein